MLWVDEEGDDRGRLGMGLVAGDRRAAPLSGGDDPQPPVRQRRNRAGRPLDRHGGGAVQDHEGRRAAAHRLRTVLGEVGEGGEDDRFADARRAFEGDFG